MIIETDVNDTLYVDLTKQEFNILYEILGATSSQWIRDSTGLSEDDIELSNTMYSVMNACLE